MNKEFVNYNTALALKELGFDEPCLSYYDGEKLFKFPGTYMCNRNFSDLLTVTAPLYQQAINFLYICSNKQIDIELKGSDTYEERVRKINQGCEDLRNLQNNKSNQ